MWSPTQCLGLLAARNDKLEWTARSTDSIGESVRHVRLQVSEFLQDIGPQCLWWVSRSKANVESICRVSELARLKLEYHNFETARRNSKQLASNDFSFDKERYDKNRKRRLMKDKNEKEKKGGGNQTTKLEDKCSKCQQEISHPYHVYVCQNGHFHKERAGSQDYKVS